jgi:hypothetical protein
MFTAAKGVKKLQENLETCGFKILKGPQLTIPGFWSYRKGRNYRDKAKNKRGPFNTQATFLPAYNPAPTA